MNLGAKMKGQIGGEVSELSKGRGLISLAPQYLHIIHEFHLHRKFTFQIINYSLIYANYKISRTFFEKFF